MLEESKLADRIRSRLEDYMYDERELETQKERLERLESKMKDVGAQVITDMPRAPSQMNDKMSDYVARKEELLQDISELETRHRTERLAIETTLAMPSHDFIMGYGAAKADTIADIVAAGEEQIQAIEDKGEEVVASIPSDYTELSSDVVELKSNTSQAVDTDAEDVDLDLIDANGNVLARFADGHIRTKNFNSANIDPPASGGNVDAKLSNSTADLVLTDAQGNVITEFSDGHIQTKDFNSAEIVQAVSENQTVLHGVSGTDYIKQFTYDPSSSSKQTITGDFKAGDTILCHVSNAADDVTDILNTRWGTYAYVDSGGIEQTLGQERPYNFARYVLPADTTQIVANIPAELLESGTYTCKFIVYKLSAYKRQPHIVTVGSDGKRQFTSVRAAMDSFHDNNAYNTYEIWVYPGTYNVLSDFSDDEISAEGFKGLWVKNGVTIRGIGHREQIILHGELDPDDYSSTIRNQISTLNMSGCCGLDNLTVTNQYLRYAVHDDHMSGFYQEQTRIVENCRFLSWNASSGGIGQAAYGAGGHNNKKLIIRNCDLGDRLIIHNTQLMVVSMTAVVENSTAQQVTLTDNNNPGFTAKTRVEFNNCNFDYILHDRTSDGTEPTMILCGSGTHGAKLDCEAGTLYNFGDGMSFPATIAAGQAVKMSGIRTVEAATAADVIYGISIGNDGSHTIVQRQGYIAAQVLGLTGLSVGDYITLDANGACVAGGTAANAVGVVECIAANTLTAFIKLLI